MKPIWHLTGCTAKAVIIALSCLCCISSTVEGSEVLEGANVPGSTLEVGGEVYIDEEFMKNQDSVRTNHDEMMFSRGASFNANQENIRLRSRTKASLHTEEMEEEMELESWMFVPFIDSLLFNRLAPGIEHEVELEDWMFNLDAWEVSE